MIAPLAEPYGDSVPLRDPAEGTADRETPVTRGRPIIQNPQPTSNGERPFKPDEPTTTTARSTPPVPKRGRPGVPFPSTDDATDCSTEPDAIPLPRPVVITLPQIRPVVDTFETLQLWEGTIIGVRGTEFTATLADLTNPKLPEETAVFDLDELSDFDLPLAKPGAVFWWNIGYQITRGGTRRKQSQIRMRRMPWTKRELEKAKAKAREFMQRFENDGG